MKAVSLPIEDAVGLWLDGGGYGGLVEGFCV